MDLDSAAFQKLPGAKSTTYVVKDDVAVISPDVVVALKKAAAEDPFKRARICLHRNNADAVHQMIIAHHRDTYTHPHRHRGKSESFHLLEGRLAVLFFDDAGAVTRRIVLGATGSAEPSVYRLSASEWHTVIPLTEYAVFHEITNGPFVRGDSDLAPWAPRETDSAAAVGAFKTRLLSGMT